MSCFTTTKILAQQLWQWVLGIFSFLESLCSTVTQQIQEWQQQWQNQCNQVTSTITQWQQQWQNQCNQVTSQICQSLPWPFSAFCGWVTSTVCNLVSVLISVVVTVVQTVCALVSVLILVVATVVQFVCTVVTLFVDLLVLVVYLILVAVMVVVCLLIPCKNPMESSFPPDDGWMVTLGLPTPPKLSMNNQVRILPDGELACHSMIAAINAATATIHLIQLEFDTDFTSTFLMEAAGPVPFTSLVCAFLKANERGVTVRILLNDNLFADSLPKLQTVFAGHPTIELAGIKIQPLQHLGMLHAKGMFIDSTVAFVDGLPFTQGYWDTQSHFVTDPRRGPGAGGNAPLLGEIGNGVGNKPAHTVSLQLIGPAATDVDATFISLWNSVNSPPVAVPAPALGLGHQAIQIVRTAPPMSAVGLSNEKGVLDAYLRAINNARSFIYIESQYLTSPVIGAALTRALIANPGLQLILLLNENPDMPTYKFWQNLLLNQLAAFPTQVGVFCLWRTKAGPEKQLAEIMQCYLEAKVSVVDDAWAAVGSANLDGASLGHIFEFLPKPLSCMSASDGWRNVELTAVFYDGIAGQPATGEAAMVREVVWKEHLGLQELPTAPPAGGWLGFWNAIAAQNLASLNVTQSMPGVPTLPSRILVYSPQLQSEDQLHQLGVNTNLLNVAPVVPPNTPSTLEPPAC